MKKQSIIVVGADIKWEEKELLSVHSDSQMLLLGDLKVSINNQAHFLKDGVDIFMSLSGDEKWIIRRSRGYYETLVNLATMLKRRGFTFTDSITSISSNLNKEIFLPTVESTIFPHPQGSFVLRKTDSLSNDGLSFPLISKPVTGRHGEGIEIHDHFESLNEAFLASQETLLVQPFLDLEAEYRIFVVGNEALGTVEKKAAPGQKVANYAAGASFSLVDLPQAYLDEAVRLSKAQQIDIAGVDVAKDKSGRYYILEINRCPEFKAFSEATGINVAKRIIDFTLNKE